MAGHRILIASVIAISLLMAGCTVQGTRAVDSGVPNPITLNKAVQLLSQGEDFLIYFRDPYCYYCKQVDPYLLPLVRSTPNFYTLDLLQHPAAWDAFAVRVTPTVARYSDGREVARLEGWQPEEAYRRLVAGDR